MVGPSVMSQQPQAYPMIGVKVTPKSPAGTKTHGSSYNIPVTIDAGYPGQKEKKKQTGDKSLQ